MSAAVVGSAWRGSVAPPTSTDPMPAGAAESYGGVGGKATPGHKRQLGVGTGPTPRFKEYRYHAYQPKVANGSASHPSGCAGLARGAQPQAQKIRKFFVYQRSQGPAEKNGAPTPHTQQLIQTQPQPQPLGQPQPQAYQSARQQPPARKRRSSAPQLASRRGSGGAVAPAKTWRLAARAEPTRGDTLGWVGNSSGGDGAGACGPMGAPAKVTGGMDSVALLHSALPLPAFLPTDAGVGAVPQSVWPPGQLSACPGLGDLPLPLEEPKAVGHGEDEDQVLEGSGPWDPLGALGPLVWDMHQCDGSVSPWLNHCLLPTSPASSAALADLSTGPLEDSMSTLMWGNNGVPWPCVSVAPPETLAAGLNEPSTMFDILHYMNLPSLDRLACT